MFSSLKASLADRHESAPRVQLGRSAESDQKDLDASGFVLIVNDDPALLDATSFVIENEGMAVETARNGEQALALIGTGRRPALVLLDLVMPVMNGRQLATRIRAADPGRAILFTTGYDDLSGTDDPFAQEFVIKKPFKLVELAAAVERALATRDRDERPAWNVTPIRQPTRT